MPWPACTQSLYVSIFVLFTLLLFTQGVKFEDVGDDGDGGEEPQVSDGAAARWGKNFVEELRI